MNTSETIRDDLEHFAFEAFATAHPHEAFASWPEKFWEFFHRERALVSRQEMERLLQETAE